ncbi:MAG: DNA polymerase III subunit delta [Candidatus Latescibacterota bacterium]
MGRNSLSNERVILLTGEEFQRLERFAELVEEAVEPATRDFNYDVFSSEDFKKEAGVGRFADIIMTFPMMAARRVAVIRDFDGVHAETRKKIAAAVKNTPDTTLVIIESEKAALTPKPPERYFRQETFKRVYENKLPEWIRGRFSRKGKRATDSAIALLINNVGDVLRELDNEIEKVCIAMSEKQTVTEEDVGRIVGAFRRHTIYAFCNAVGTGDFPEAARILQYLMDSEKNKETYYVSTLAAHLMKIAEYNTQVRAGIPRDDAMKMVTESPFLWKLNRMEEQARNFGKPETVRRALEAITETDSALKKSAVDKELLVEFMLPRVMP